MMLLEFRAVFSKIVPSIWRGCFTADMPIYPLNDPPLSEFQLLEIQEVERRAIKNISTSMLIQWNSENHLTLLLARLNKQTNRTVLFVSVDDFIDEETHSMSALFAEAERTNMIIYLNDAQSLLASHFDEVAVLKKSIVNYPGLVILALNDTKQPIDSDFWPEYQLDMTSTSNR